MSRRSEQVRLLTIDDIPLIERLLRTSEYVYQRFTQEELPLLLERYPAVGIFNGTSLHSFLLSQSINPPSAWVGGFGVSWTESRAYPRIFSTLLDSLSPHLTACGVQYLHYSGNDVHRDWLRGVLLAQGFFPYCQLYAYDKFDYGIPTRGNAQVTIRPVDVAKDMPALLTIEALCFDDLWRYDASAFTDIAATHPYFVVAELNGNIVGYQFNALDDSYGYLVRIAVHPSFEHRGIGARLMAEAIRFFQRARVLRIMLNSQENNNHAHRLYEWFGFVRLEQMGFVLQKHLAL
jgi:[ribosomal protein S18]-alanine N-acetyltransferase